jgi:CHAD domain-containing protein
VSTESAHTSGMGKQAGVVLFSQWNEFCDLRKLVLRQGHGDAIHDLRVASRRMRATLGLLAPFITGKAVKRICQAHRRVTKALGRLRNLDEAIIYFEALPVALPSLSGMLSRARNAEMRRVTILLKAFPRQKLDRMLRAAVADLAGIPDNDQSLALHLSETSIQRYQTVHDLLLPATTTEKVEIRHALRIAIKKWRYLLETLGQVCRQDYSATLETLKEYQTLLGRLNDMVEFTVLCHTLKIPAHEAGEIKAALERDTADCLARFIETAATRPPQYTFSL